jgi:hypothetical protein
MGMEGPAADIQRLVDQEADLIAGAMRLVAAGGARRTVIAGLQHTDAALAIATPQAAALGLRVEAIPRRDRTGHDVAVTRMAAARPA